MGWQLIKSYTVGDSVTAAPAASVTFDSIPGTYKTLKVMISGRDNVAATWSQFTINLNGNSSNFTNRYLYGDGTAAISSTGTTQAGWVSSASATSNTFSNIEITIPNYAGSTNKPFSADIVTENNGTFALQMLMANLWSNTSAITSLTLACSSGNFVFGSTFTLYGLL